MRERVRQLIAAGVILVAALLAFTGPGNSLWQRFFSSLRIAKPQPVSVTIPGFSGPTPTHRLQDAIGGMIADTTSVTLDEADKVQVDDRVGIGRLTVAAR